MEGFYSKDEAAHILGISVRSVTNYMIKGKIRKVKSGKRVWLPKEDVHAIFDGMTLGLVPGRDEFNGALARIEDLERTVEILKNSMGFRGRREKMTEQELFLFRTKVFQSLSLKKWSVRTISETSTNLMSFSPEEISGLIHLHGPMAWRPFLQLSGKMTRYLKNHTDYPGRGLGALLERLETSQNRFLGLVYASRHIDTGLRREHADRVLRSVTRPILDIDLFITDFLRGERK